MTAKEMFKKVEQYNKIGEEIGREKVEIRFDYHITETVHTDEAFATFKEWRKHIKKTYHEFAFAALVDFDGYEFNKTVNVPVKYFAGTTYEADDKIAVSFNI